jgi:hypothetical protein
MAALAILLATATVTAQVFKWIDKDGKVHFSDTPPPAQTVKGDVKKMTVNAPAPSGGSTAAKPAEPTKSGARGRSDKNEKGEKGEKVDPAEAARKAEDADKLAKQNAAQCKEATRYLSTLETGAPIMRNNDAGERSYMSDDERSAEVARAKGTIAEACKA